MKCLYGVTKSRRDTRCSGIVSLRCIIRKLLTCLFSLVVPSISSPLSWGLYKLYLLTTHNHELSVVPYWDLKLDNMLYTDINHRYITCELLTTLSSKIHKIRVTVFVRSIMYIIIRTKSIRRSIRIKFFNTTHVLYMSRTVNFSQKFLQWRFRFFSFFYGILNCTVNRSRVK